MSTAKGQTLFLGIPESAALPQRPLQCKVRVCEPKAGLTQSAPTAEFAGWQAGTNNPSSYGDLNGNDPQREWHCGVSFRSDMLKLRPV